MRILNALFALALPLAFVIFSVVALMKGNNHPTAKIAAQTVTVPQTPTDLSQNSPNPEAAPIAETAPQTELPAKTLAKLQAEKSGTQTVATAKPTGQTVHAITLAAQNAAKPVVHAASKALGQSSNKTVAQAGVQITQSSVKPSKGTMQGTAPAKEAAQSKKLQGRLARHVKKHEHRIAQAKANRAQTRNRRVHEESLLSADEVAHINEARLTMNKKPGRGHPANMRQLPQDDEAGLVVNQLTSEVNEADPERKISRSDLNDKSFDQAIYQ